MQKNALCLLLLCASSVAICISVLISLDSYKEPCAAYIELDGIMFALESWKQTYGYYPNSLRDMVRTGNHRDDEPGLEFYPKDPYGHDFELEFINSKPCIIYYGKDGVPGGAGENRDWRWPQDRDRARRVSIR